MGNEAADLLPISLFGTVARSRTSLFRVALIFLIAAPFAIATEKLWVAGNAELAIVGRLHQYSVIPWLDGWHVRGTT